LGDTFEHKPSKSPPFYFFPLRQGTIRVVKPMEKIPFYVRHHVSAADNRETLRVRSEQSVLSQLINRVQDQNPYFLERIASRARVLIVEGISGSGKDTFQAYLKTKLKGRDVYDYSEGEVLNSWKQLQIAGIFELRIKFMKFFVNYVRDILNREENAVFLLNRFHLSAYVFTILQQPKLETEYEEIINILKTLPVHVFMLQLDKNEIEARSLHPERSGAWRKFQQQIVERDGFRGRLERYVLQQRLMLEKAETQQMPYSVIKFPYGPEMRRGQVRISETRSALAPDVRPQAGYENISRRKRRVTQTVE
jgi:thymidylate kinase